VSRRSGSVKLIMATMVAMTAGRSAPGADWSETLEAVANAAYDTNPQLLPGSHMSDQSAQLAADGSTTMQTELGQLTVTPRLSIVRYARETNLDIDTGNVNVSYVEKLERGQWNIGGQATTDSTVTSELGTTGITSVNFRHYQDNATLGYQYLSTERLSWQVQGSWQTARYNADAQHSGLTNYDYGSVQVGPTWTFSERVQGSLILGADRINPQFAPTEKDYSANLQLNRSLSERYAWRASIGGTRVESGSGPSGSSSLFETGVTWRGERIQWDVSVKRSVLPIGLGLLARQDAAALSVLASTTEHSTLNLSFNAIRSYPVTAVFNIAPGISLGFPVYSGASWGQATAEWQYHFSPNWALSAAYMQARARNENAPEWANRKQARLGIVWQSGRL
jgi:hypothetical protein